jgi:hypothetical protein
MKRSLILPIFAGVCAAAMTIVAACDNSSGNPTDNGSTGSDASTPSPSPTTQPEAGVTILPDGSVVPNEAAPPSPDASDCFTNPKTHFEIINACTSAQKIAKSPSLPLLLPDGGLPPPP